MAKHPISGLHDQSSTVRQLKLLVVVLVLSNIGLGVFAFFLLRQIDRQYSDLIGRSVPVLNSLQTSTAQALRAMRATNPALLSGGDPPQSFRLEEARAVIARDRDLRGQLLKSDWAVAVPERNDVAASGEAFTRLAGEVLGLIAAGRVEAGAEMREATLRPAFERYIAAITKAADVLEAESERINASVSARTGSWSTVVLGVASWPLVVLVLLLVLTAVFVVVLMVLFRGREMSDMP